MRSRRATGFTLVEVMVALAIVSIGLIAVFNAIIQMAHSTSTMRERALADWIAMNEITGIRIAGDFPEIGRFDGDTRFAGRDWRWEAEISETGVEDLRRIDMSVAYEGFPEDPVTIMTGFITRSSGPGARIDWWGGGADAPGDEDEAEGENTDSEEPPGDEQPAEAPGRPDEDPE
ncbi:MAG TPA: type II secretion system minor pseudopilin GspI [Gammaproteobacteria bacterium]|nr:type II secretion system minor pseudopilin GspI [Gammaproteobacteria bacterium]